MPDDDKIKDLHEVQTPKKKGERLEELGQRVMSPPPLDKAVPDDATKGQRVHPPPSPSLPEIQQVSPQVAPSSQETPQTPPAQVPTSPSPQQTPPHPPSGDSSQSNTIAKTISSEDND